MMFANMYIDTKPRSFKGTGFRQPIRYFVEIIFFKTNDADSIIGWIANPTK